MDFKYFVLLIFLSLLLLIFIFQKRGETFINYMANINESSTDNKKENNKNTDFENNLGQNNSLKDLPDCTQDQLTKNKCNQCSPNAYCCMNSSIPACSPAGGQPIPCSADQCKVPSAPSPSSITTCSTTDISKGRCNECPKGYYCCPSNPPGQPPGCSATPFTSCSTKQCKYVPQPLKNPRTFTFNNNCNQDICVGYIGKDISGQSASGGFNLAKNSNVNKQITGNWQNGRIWGRTGCNSSCTNCATGECDGTTCTTAGKPPTTLFEVTMDQNVGYDTYDGSLVSGFNLPIEIKPVDGTSSGAAPQYDCQTISCNMNISQCPAELVKSVNGQKVGCYDLCDALNDPTNLNIFDQKCKSGEISGCPNGASDIDKDLACCSCGQPKQGCPVDQLPKDGQGNPINGCAIEGNQKESTDLIKSCCKYGCSPNADPGKSLDKTKSPVCDMNQWPKPVKYCQDNGISSKDCNYPNVFSKICPNFYSWQFADRTSTYQCRNSDYQITFCPTNQKKMK